mmetsp:Transcript_68098/g.154064  ORF Transcript_68098/g.154064 Transcript_68098/m.154064 type:complete len:101 (+) Transcript_68098:91-393(+)
MHRERFLCPECVTNKKIMHPSEPRQEARAQETQTPQAQQTHPGPTKVTTRKKSAVFATTIFLDPRHSRDVKIRTTKTPTNEGGYKSNERKNNSRQTKQQI